MTRPLPDDPFMAELVRRHPEVDVVLLPPPSPGARPPAPDIGVDEAERATLDAATQAWRTLAATGVVAGPPELVRLTWRRLEPQGDGVDAAAPRLTARGPAGTGGLDSLGNAEGRLAAVGFDTRRFRVRAPGGVRLQVRRGGERSGRDVVADVIVWGTGQPVDVVATGPAGRTGPDTGARMTQGTRDLAVHAGTWVSA